MAKLEKPTTLEPSAPKVLKPAGPKTDLSRYISNSRKQFLKTSEFATHGPLKAGKSFFAATASAFYPDGLQMEQARSIESIGEARWKKLPWVTLEDMIWIPYDAGALDGFAQYKIEIPAIDVSQIFQDCKPPEAVRTIDKAVEQIAKSNKQIKWGVEDTASEKDRLLLDWFLDHPVLTSKGLIDKYAPYQSLKAAHLHSRSVKRSTGLKMHYLFHSKAAPEATTHQQEMVDATMALPSVNSDVEPEITGQALKAYLGNASVIAVLWASEVPAYKHPWERYKRTVMPFGGKNFTGGNRLQTFLKQEMVPHLGLMIETMQRALDE